jgi:hypothetical protein
MFRISHLLLAHNPPEALLSDLGLCGRDGSCCIRVIESTSILSVLERRRLSRANAGARSIGAAGGAAIRVRNATASDELRGITSANGLCAGDVRSDLRGSKAGNWTCVSREELCVNRIVTYGR